MEKPYTGRAIIQDNFTDLQIIIPPRRNWFMVIFTVAWLGAWVMGEMSAIGTLKGITDGHPVNLFMLFWLTGWTVGGVFVVYSLLWNLFGKEVITIGQGRLTINKKGALFFRPKVYDVNEVRNIRVQDDNFAVGGLFGRRRNDFGPLNKSGTIRFDYGLQTVKFAGGIDEAEARFIVDTLKKRHLLAEKSYS